MPGIRLICTDLDGTLWKGTLHPEEFMKFRSLLQRAYREWRGEWAIVTGRPLRDMQPILANFLTFGMLPRFLVLEDALIYRRNFRGTYSACWWWNTVIMWRRTRVFRHQAGLVEEWREDLLRLFPGTVNRGSQMVDLWLEFVDEQTARRGEEVLLDRVGRNMHFYVFRWGRELFLAPAAGTKGQAVRKLSRKLRLYPEEVFAVGDGPNDMTMLDGRYARFSACVANALPQIKQVVEKAGGFVANEEGIAGVNHALESAFEHVRRMPGTGW
jgi:hydroxymethylpyrimidine pyrophosphatase-like HAD family hydrolase